MHLCSVCQHKVLVEGGHHLASLQRTVAGSCSVLISRYPGFGKFSQNLIGRQSLLIRIHALYETFNVRRDSITHAIQCPIPCKLREGPYTLCDMRKI